MVSHGDKRCSDNDSRGWEGVTRPVLSTWAELYTLSSPWLGPFRPPRPRPSCGPGKRTKSRVGGECDRQVSLAGRGRVRACSHDCTFLSEWYHRSSDELVARLTGLGSDWGVSLCVCRHLEALVQGPRAQGHVCVYVCVCVGSARMSLLCLTSVRQWVRHVIRLGVRPSICFISQVRRRNPIQ